MLPEATLPLIGSKELVAWLPTLLGLGAGDVVVYPEAAYPTYAAGVQVAGARGVACDDLDPARRRGHPAGAGLAQLALQPDRRGAGAGGARGTRRLGPRARGAIVASDECYGEFGWEADPVSVLHPDVAGGQPRRPARRLLAVQAVQPRRLPRGLRRRRPRAGRRAARGPQAPRDAGAAPGAGRHGRRARRHRARRGPARAVRRPAGPGCVRRSRRPASRSTTPRPASTCGRPAARTAGRRSPGWPSAGILVAPGDFYGRGGPAVVRFALTATDERVDAAVERLLRPDRLQPVDRRLSCRVLVDAEVQRTVTRTVLPASPGLHPGGQVDWSVVQTRSSTSTRDHAVAARRWRRRTARRPRPAAGSSPSSSRPCPTLAVSARNVVSSDSASPSASPAASPWTRQVSARSDCPVSALASTRASGSWSLVRVGVRAALHRLRDLGDVAGLPVLHPDERVVELRRRVVGVHQLLLAAPALRRPLLEQPDRVAVAVVEVPDARTPGRRWPSRSSRPAARARGARRARRRSRCSAPGPGRARRRGRSRCRRSAPRPAAGAPRRGRAASRAAPRRRPPTRTTTTARAARATTRRRAYGGARRLAGTTGPSGASCAGVRAGISAPLLVAVQRRVQLDGRAGAATHLDGAADGVPQEQQAVLAGERDAP